MPLPLCQTIEVPASLVNDRDAFKAFVNRQPFGSCPVILALPSNIQTREMAIDMLKDYFESKEINPSFPYATYLSTEAGDGQNFFPTLKDIDQPPKHFVKKIKKIKKREQNLLTKSITMAERVANHSISKDLFFLKNCSLKNKRLKNLISEKVFLLELRDKIRGKK